MTHPRLAVSRPPDQAVAAFGALVSLLIFRAYLVPNTFPAGFDRWREVPALHLGTHDVLWTAVALCLLTGIVWGLYYPLVSTDGGLMGLWLTTGAWLGVTVGAILFSGGDLALVGRETDLLLGYVSGLAAARLFRRLDEYVTALIACGAVQSVIAIVDHSRTIHTHVSGSVISAGGTFDAPGDLYLIPVFILPLAVERILSSRESGATSTAFYMLCASSMLTALVLTWERSGLLACCVGLFWLARKYMAGTRQGLGLVVASLLVCGVFLARSNGPGSYASSAHSVRARSYLLKEGVLVFGRHWFEGVGVGSLSVPVPTTINGHTENVRMLQPYNQFLFCLDEMGVTGAVLLALFSAFIYRVAFSRSSPAAQGVAAAWMSVAIAGMFNTLFGVNDFSCGNMLIGSLIGMTMRLNGADRTDETWAGKEDRCLRNHRLRPSHEEA